MIIKRYSNKELAALYDMEYQCWLRCVRKIRKNLAAKGIELGEPYSGSWMPAQVQLMVDVWGPAYKEIAE